MQLKHTKSGTPFIELTDGIDDYGTLIFSKMTSCTDGYKYVCFRRIYEDVVAVTKGKGKNKSKTTMSTQVNDSYVFNMKMKRDEKGVRGVPTGMMPRPLVQWIIDTFEPFLIDDRIFPYSKIEELAEIVDAADITKLVETKQEKAKRKRKEKKRKKQIEKEVSADLKLTDMF